MYVSSCLKDQKNCVLGLTTPYREIIGDIEDAAALKNVSLVAWQRINLEGRYEVTKNTGPIDMTEIIRVLAKVPVREIQYA